MTKENFGLNIHKPDFFKFVTYVRQMMKEGIINLNWMAYKKDDFRGTWKQGRFRIIKEQNSALHNQNNHSSFHAHFRLNTNLWDGAETHRTVWRKKRMLPIPM